VVQFGLHYLLDTNTVRYVIKGSFPHVRERLAEVPIREVGTSVITEAKSRFGVARLEQAAKLGTVVEEFLRRIEVMAWDSAAAQRYGRLRAVLEEQGDPMGNMDLNDRGSRPRGRGNPGKQRSRLSQSKGAASGRLDKVVIRSATIAPRSKKPPAFWLTAVY